MIKVLKITDVKTPTRGTSKSAGIDLYVPNNYGTTYLAPGESVFIPSGLKFEIPEGFALIAFNKSGVALKKGLTVGGCVIDEDYEGESHIHLINISDESTQIQAGEKIVQLVLVPMYYHDIEEVESEDEMWINRKSERGTGGFGSTGNGLGGDNA